MASRAGKDLPMQLLTSPDTWAGCKPPTGYWEYRPSREQCFSWTLTNIGRAQEALG